jgi:F0F1-type ATP synthase alpha subunit
LSLYALTNKYFSSINVEQIRKIESAFLKFISVNYESIAIEIREKGEISGELEEKIKSVINEFMQEHAENALKE